MENIVLEAQVCIQEAEQVMRLGKFHIMVDKYYLISKLYGRAQDLTIDEIKLKKLVELEVYYKRKAYEAEAYLQETNSMLVFHPTQQDSHEEKEEAVTTATMTDPSSYSSCFSPSNPPQYHDYGKKSNEETQVERANPLSSISNRIPCSSLITRARYPDVHHLSPPPSQQRDHCAPSPPSSPVIERRNFSSLSLQFLTTGFQAFKDLVIGRRYRRSDGRSNISKPKSSLDESFFFIKNQEMTPKELALTRELAQTRNELNHIKKHLNQLTVQNQHLLSGLASGNSSVGLHGDNHLELETCQPMESLATGSSIKTASNPLDLVKELVSNR